MVSVDVKHHVYLLIVVVLSAQELCESQGGRPGPTVCGRKATLLLLRRRRRRHQIQIIGF